MTGRIFRSSGISRLASFWFPPVSDTVTDANGQRLDYGQRTRSWPALTWLAGLVSQPRDQSELARLLIGPDTSKDIRTLLQRLNTVPEGRPRQTDVLTHHLEGLHIATSGDQFRHALLRAVWFVAGDLQADLGGRVG
ncbi:hypothetical protein ACFYP6_31040 [Streptomyces goshikiensis]|uniref:hypothetical protein n=1 Tax=Streptomyces goshikiensis TaxID=1942 RepID=UPI0036C8B345